MQYIVFEFGNGGRAVYPTTASKKFLTAQRRYINAKYGIIKETIQTVGA